MDGNKIYNEFYKHVKENFIDFFRYLYNTINDRLLFKRYNGLMIQFTSSWNSNNTLFFDWFNNIIDDCNNSSIKIPFSFVVSLSKDDYYEYVVDKSDKYSTVCELKLLKSVDVRNYFKNSFNKFNWEITDDVLDLLVKRCHGNPSSMQRIGNKIYYRLSRDDFNEMEKKGLRVYGSITGKKLNNPNYIRKILDNEL